MPDRAMGMLATHHDGVGLTGQADIVGVVPCTAQQHRVFGARNRLPDSEPLVEPQNARIYVVVHEATSQPSAIATPVASRLSTANVIEDIAKRQDSRTEIANESRSVEDWGVPFPRT